MVNDASDLLTQNTLAKITRLAQGNGIDLKSIEVIESKEETYTLEAQIRLTPLFDAQARSYAGPIKGKGAKAVAGFIALQQEVNSLKEKHNGSPEWVDEVVKELEKEPGYGWGHDNGKIVLPENQTTLAANEKCPACQAAGLITCAQCQGKGTVMCTYCYGRGEEPCTTCFGKGEDPAYPGQPCRVCRGTRMAPCRYCRNISTGPSGLHPGLMLCPACNGKGGTPCPACQGKGSMTQEVKIETGATFKFQTLQSATPLPSGLLRMLDRLGMTSLPKGHADIERIEPEKGKEQEKDSTIHLKAKIPFAEIKMRLNGKPAIATAFGKKGIVSMPPFLDESLKPFRDHLAQAAAGRNELDKALKARAINDALQLELSGRSTANDLRRLYPLGLSPGAAQEIMKNTGLALGQMTKRSRTSIAIVSLFLSAGVFAGFFLTPLGGQLEQDLPPKTFLLLKAFLPVILMGLSGYALSQATKLALQKRFPDLEIRLGQGIGKIGYSTLVAILALYAAVMAVA